MATPRRTSARLRARTPNKTFEPSAALGSLIEGNENTNIQPEPDHAVQEQRSGHIPGAFENDSFLFTPSSRPEPDRENMHPSKVQQSTTKAADEGLILGFSDIKKKDRPATIEDTPSKSKLASPGFEFKFANAESDLTAETKRIMDSVREEAARIKEQMRRDRDEENQKKTEGQVEISGRKIVQPKSRFSDAHKAQFSKMDSIANHPSVLKHKKPIEIKPEETAPKMLKRTQSKAELSDDRPENPAPSKRAKSSGSDDVSIARPASRDGTSITRPINLPSAVTTPTKASLARSTSAKSIRSTNLPNLISSRPGNASAKKAKPESAASSLFGLKKSFSMKSILSKPQPKYSDDPIKIAAGTHLPIQEQPESTPVKQIKRVGFAEELTSPTPNRPTGLRMPTKVPTPYRRTAAAGPVTRDPSSSPTKEPEGISLPNIFVSTSPSKSPSGLKRQPEEMDIKSDPIIVGSPSPRKIMMPMSVSKVSNDQVVSYPRLDALLSSPTKPGDFTFRAERQIRFGPSQTIRTVRPSGTPTTIKPFPELPSVPHGMPNKKRSRPIDDEEEERENQPPSEHGSPTKKLRAAIGQDIAPLTPRKRLTKYKPASVPAGGKTTLSLSRLNFLARPKNRG